MRSLEQKVADAMRLPYRRQFVTAGRVGAILCDMGLFHVRPGRFCRRLVKLGLVTANGKGGYRSLTKENFD